MTLQYLNQILFFEVILTRIFSESQGLSNDFYIWDRFLDVFAYMPRHSRLGVINMIVLSLLLFLQTNEHVHLLFWTGRIFV